VNPPSFVMTFFRIAFAKKKTQVGKKNQNIPLSLKDFSTRPSPAYLYD